MNKTSFTAGIIGFLRKHAKGRNVFFLFGLTTAVYVLMLCWSMPLVRAKAPDLALFDMSPGGYSYQHALLLLNHLGEDGRKKYLFPQLGLDFIYPGLFAACYSMMLTWLFSKRLRPTSKLMYLALLPVLAGIFDYAENIAILQMLVAYPSVSRPLVTTASTFTILKSVLTTASLCLVALGFFLWRREKSGSTIGKCR